MVKLEDPVTDTTYNPISDPTGTAFKFIMMVGGLAMTLLALNIAQTNVVPNIQQFIANLTGTNVGGSDSPGIPVAGEGGN